jgi:lipopolysaccharide export system protein LptC
LTLRARTNRLGPGARVATAIGLAALGLGSWWWLSEQRAGEPVTERVRQPDSYFRQLDALRHDANGNPEMRLTATYAEHFEDESGIFLHDFAAEGGLLPDEPGWRLSAARGHVSDDGVELDASGDVLLVRDNDGAAPMRIETQALSVNTETRLAVTDELVLITQGAGRVRGRGMRASLQDDHLRLEQDVEAHYEK